MYTLADLDAAIDNWLDLGFLPTHAVTRINRMARHLRVNVTDRVAIRRAAR